MATYLPPSENLPIFDTSVFDETNGAYLTYTSAKKLFLTYPTAQGEETIASLIAGSIDYTSPASGSYFDIGTNQVSGGTVRIGPTGTSGVSVHAGNIDCTNNTINNATDAAANNLALGNSQTTGVLNIGTGTRTTGGNGGAINIGTGGSVTAPINIGGGASSSNTINIGQTGATTGTTTTNINTSSSGAHPVNIGSSTSITTLSGTVNTGVGKIAGGETIVGTGLPYTIPNTVNITSTFVINTAAITGTITLPTNVAGRTITIRNLTVFSHTISSPSGNIWPINTPSFSASLALEGLSSVVLIGDGGTWYQIGPTNTLQSLTVNGTTTATGLVTATAGLTTPASVTATTSIISPTYGPSSDAADVTFCGTQTGTINIGTAARTTTGKSINIGTNTSSSNPINIGGTNTSASSGTLSSSPISINGSTFWSNLSGAFSLRSASTIDILATFSSAINIGTSVASGNGNAITIGSSGSTSSTTINGKLITSLGILSGNDVISVISANFTIPSTINQQYYVFCNAGAAYTITLPTRLSNQVIQFRNFSGNTLTITAPTTSPVTNIYPTGSTIPFSPSWTGFANNTITTLICDGNNWLGF